MSGRQRHPVAVPRVRSRTTSILFLSALSVAVALVGQLTVSTPAAAADESSNLKAILLKAMTPCFADRAEVNCVDEEPKITNPDWMARLTNDSLRLANIAIPGTHQSASLFGGALGQCQIWGVKEQLMAGIRFLDIRVRLLQDVKSEGDTAKVEQTNYFLDVAGWTRTLSVFHGPLYQLVTFEQVLRDIRVFLKEHPKEAVLMALNEEIYTKEERTKPPFIQELTRVLVKNSDILWCCDRVPRLGEIRGKIVIIRQYGSRPHYGLDVESFWTQNHWDVPTLWNLETKQQRFAQLMKLPDRTSSWTYPLINYASASGWAAHPYMVAARMNKFVLDLLENECNALRVGIIPMDFPGYGIIDRIIDVNFCQKSRLRKPSNYGTCRSQWKIASFSCEVTDNKCAAGHTVIQSWRGWTCMCSCQNVLDPDDKGCRTIREDWCE